MTILLSFLSVILRGKIFSSENGIFIKLFWFCSDSTILNATPRRYKKSKKGGPIMSLLFFVFCFFNTLNLTKNVLFHKKIEKNIKMFNSSVRNVWIYIHFFAQEIKKILKANRFDRHFLFRYYLEVCKNNYQCYLLRYYIF